MRNASVAGFSSFFFSFFFFFFNKRAVPLLSFGLHCTEEMESLFYLLIFYEDMQILRENE